MKIKELFSLKKKKLNKPFVIAEIGHNHQGDVKKAMDLIRVNI